MQVQVAGPLEHDNRQTLIAAIDTNIVLISLPTIGRELPVLAPTTLLWILLGYSLLTSVVLLNFGRLSDMFGRVRLYVLGFAVFTIGSLLCGFSQTGTELVAFRLIQPWGRLPLLELGRDHHGRLPAERARSGPRDQPGLDRGRGRSGLVLGGIITSTIGWRWIFFVNVPIGIIATIRAYTDLHELVLPSEKPHIDWLGNIVFALGLTLVLLGVTLGALGNVPGWTGLGMALLGIALLAVFAWIETREKSPMLDLSLFRIREFSATATAMLLNALARGAFTFVLVFYLQGPPRFLNPFTAGLYLIPVSASPGDLRPDQRVALRQGTVPAGSSSRVSSSPLRGFCG